MDSFDFHKTFSLMMKSTTIRVVFSIFSPKYGTIENWIMQILFFEWRC